ncbi:ArnT family glycosyltransferase [Shewanella waksmanii]|uniref:ArnT family glycosyltransferase n=1 Tax=Shewanella waksmanii TaxID=213783 RepID=UPI00373670CF
MNVTSRLAWPALILLVVILTVRLISLSFYPLMDTTEARYGEMARLMVETGNWLTPLFDYNVPFWGKPPLHTWMSAAGLKLFGVNEFAARVPHWFTAVLTLALVAGFARKLAISALQSAIILSTCVVFYISAGAVMTDMALTLGMTLAMIGFYLCWQGDYRWGYAGFSGLAIGLLAKGPVVIVLMGIAVFMWLLWCYGPVKLWGKLWRKVPLISGLLLMLAIAAPWYMLAEKATPGFLQYFLVGEHWLRFVDSGWTGDLYGSAHDEPRGTIWLFFVVAAMPWSLFLPWALWRLQRSETGLAPLHKFLICWMLAPMVLFTLAGNILPAYVLPGIPALALLLSSAWQGKAMPGQAIIAATIPLLLAATVVVLNTGPSKLKSDKWLLSDLPEATQVYYVGKRPFSSRFYSEGQSVAIAPKQLTQLTGQDYWLVVPQKQVAQLDLGHCQLTRSTKDKQLLQCQG